jgi:thiol:disulfide interchange protein DsbD
MERFTFTDPEVRARVERMLLLKADMTANSPDDKALLQRFVYGRSTIFFDPTGRRPPPRHRVQPAGQFAAKLDALQPAW